MVIGQGALIEEMFNTTAPGRPIISLLKICVGISVPTKFKSKTVLTPAILKSKKVVISLFARSAGLNVSFVVFALG
ncbi:hypothetical protein D3C77_597500 [compost metagenome]